MNVMLAAGGYPWTVIPVERRSHYTAALDDASIRQDLEAFAQFLGRLVRGGFEENQDPRFRGASRTPFVYPLPT